MHFDVTANETIHQVSLHVGQRLEVALHATKGMSNWSRPTTNDESVLAPTVDPAATAARYVTLAAFEARRPGAAEVTAYASPLCSPGQACPMYAELYSLRVTVTQ